MAPWLLCLAAVILTLPLMCGFPRVCFTPEILPGFGDRWGYFLPNSFYMDACLHHGELPLWNPLILCGAPFAPNPQVAVFYPPNLVRGALVCDPSPMKTQFSLIVYCVLHLVMAGLATFALARRHGMGLAGSITAAFTFIYSQPLQETMWTQMNVPATLAWLPVTLLLLNHGIHAEGFWRRTLYCLLMAMAFGMALLAGFPEHAWYMAIFIASYAILCSLLSPPESGACNTTLKSLLHTACFVAVAFAVAVLIAAVLFAPAAELADLSMRHALVNPHSSQPPWTRLVRRMTLGVLLLVAAGLTHPRKRDVSVFLLIAFLFFGCALGPPFPPATAVRACAPWELGLPARAAYQSDFALSMLAGFGVAALAGSAVPTPRRLGRLLFLAVMGCAYMLLLGRAARLAETWVDRVGASTAVWPFGVLAIAVILAAWTPAFRRVWCVVLPILLVAESGIWSDRIVQARRKPQAYPGDMQALLDAPSVLSTANRRGVSRPENASMYGLRFATTGYEPTMISDVWQVLCRPGMEAEYNRMLSAQDCAANPWGNLFLKRQFWLTEQYVPGLLPPKDTVFPPTTVAFVQSPAELPVRCVQRADVLRQSVSQNRSRIELTGSIRNTTPKTGKRDGLEIEIGPISSVAPTRQPPQHSALYLQCGASGEILVTTTFLDPSSGESTLGREWHFSATTWESWLVEVPMPDFAQLVAKVSVRYLQPQSKFAVANAYLLKDEADLNAHLTITERWANSVKVAVSDVGKHSILMFVEAAYPGWRAYVDGRETPIWRANNAFQAVVLPPGDHQVEFRFRPVRVYLGLAISLLAVAAASAAALFAWSRSKRPAVAPSTDAAPAC